LGGWNSIINQDSAPISDKTKVEERLGADITKSNSVKDRLNVWAKPKDDTLATDPDTVAERLAEAKAGVGLKDRMSTWNETANKQDVFVRKDPIKIPDTEPTKDNQGK